MVSMREVELVEDDEPLTTRAAGAASSPRRGGRLRLRRRWLAVPVAGLALLVGVQQVLTVQERHREHRFDGRPGFVEPLRPPLRALWRSEPNLGMDPRPVGHTAIVTEFADELAARAVDVHTGTTLWRTPLHGAWMNARCTPELHSSGAPPTHVVCVGFDFPDRGVSAPGEVTVLDAATGDRLSSWQVSDASSFDAADGLVVFALDHGKGRGEARAHHLLDGTPAWATATGGSRDDTNPSSAVFLAAGEALVLDGGGDLDRLDLHDGSQLASAQPLLSIEQAPDGRTALVGTGRSPTTTLVLGPGHDVSLPGSARGPVADDGSLPGVVLTQGDDLSAYDARTGDLRWHAPYEAFDVLVRDHVVFAAGATDLSAFDGRTGRLLWRTDVGGDVSQLLTDGAHVLARVSQAGAQPDVRTSAVVAVSPGSGKVAWSSTVADRDDGYLVAVDGVLLSLGERLTRLG